MKQIKDEKYLIEQLFSDVTKTDISSIAILAGHFPIRVNRKTKSIYEDLSVWGDFSLCTLELGLKVGQYAKEKGRKVEIVFLCDDQTYRDEDKKFLAEKKSLSDAQLDNRWRSDRDAFYKEHSGVNVSLPNQYQALFTRYGFSTDDIAKHDHGKTGRHDCLYFSESVLRDPKRRPQTENLENITACSREYISLLGNVQLKIGDVVPYLVSFIPNKCSHYVCDAVDFFVKDFNGSHIFMDTLEKPKCTEMYVKGVFYKKDAGLEK